MLASCTSQEEDNNLEATDVGAVQIKITQDIPETRTGAGISNTVATGATLNITKGGHLYFVNNGGNITKYVEILGSGTGDAETKVSISDLQAGISIKKVPSNSKTVHIFLNLPTRINKLPKATSIPFKSVTDSLVRVVELADPDATNTFGVDSVPVSGSGNLAADGTNLQAMVNVSPIASRIEIGTIKTQAGTGNNAQVTIKSFDLMGIFINNYYCQLKLDNAYVNADVRNAGSVVANYTEGNSGFWWRSTVISPNPNYGQYLFTGNGGSTKITAAVYTTNPATVKPNADANKVWGYNVFPGTAANEPHIVLRLANVVLNDKTAALPAAGTDYALTGDQYVTVKGFKTTSDVAIDGLVRGYVYKIGVTSDFYITPDNITDEPETNPISAKVTISLVTWTAQAVKPEY
jgi:hypothetical protein